MNTRYLLTGFLLVGVLIGAVYFFRKSHAPVMPASSPSTAAHTVGPQKAPVQIEEYSDFQCPACRKAEPAIKKILSDYPEQIRFIFHHFPLPGHPWSGLAHQAAECAGLGGKFWEYHDKLYDEQPVWSGSGNPTEFFLGYARNLGMDLDGFAACLSDEKIRRRILLDKGRGEGLKVQSVPTFFINGERLVGPVEFENRGKAKIESVLGKPQNMTPVPAPSEKTS